MKSRSPRKRKLAARKRKTRLSTFEPLEARQLLTGDLIGSDFVEGQVMVQFSEEATFQDKQDALNMVGGSVESSFTRINGALITIPSAADEANVAATLQGLPQVTYAGFNRILESQAVPNDPLFDLQWGLNNTGQDPTGGTPDADIDAPEAWDVFQGREETIVAVLDSGIDYTHPDLIPNLWVNPLEIPGNGLDDDGNGYVDDIHGADTQGDDGDPLDGDGHGTHVAGILGAAGNNGIGIAGVNWNTKIMAVRMGDAGFAIADIVEALDYISTMKARGENIVVSNNSYGGLAAQADPMLYAAVNDSIAAGIVFVAAAGNDGDNNDLLFFEPAGFDLDGVITVSATDRDDNLADINTNNIFSSNFGATTVDLSAPGVEIISTVPFGTTAAQLPDGYDAYSGTSMAAPHVAGAIALAAGLNPSLSVMELKNLVLDTVDIIPDLIDTSLTGGRLNVGRLLDELPSSEIRGQVFEDVNGNGLREPGEQGLGGWTVYTDVNNNSVLDPLEPSTITRFDGSYTLKHFLGPGTFTVREVLEPGFQFTVPAGGSRTVSFSTFEQEVTGIDFGNRQEQITVSGTVTQENNDPNLINPGVPGVYVFGDLNANGRADINEPFDFTDEEGDYLIGLPGFGDVEIMVQLPPGWEQLDPVSGGYDLTVTPGQALTDLDFLLQGQMKSFGAAPDSYGPAAHGILGGFHLGEMNIGEADAAAATTDDADGVTFGSALTEGAAVVPTISVLTTGQSRGYAQGWIDFNRDGVFSSDEQIIKNERLGEGDHSLPAFTVPAGVDTGDTWARFRYGWEFDLGPNDESFAGEVEDFTVTVFGNEPVAVDDEFPNIAQNSTFTDNPLDVLNNDVVSAAGGSLFISDFDATTDEGGMVRQVGSTLQYQPQFGFFGADSFMYTIMDGAGMSSTATVTLFVVPDFDGPVAIDDMYSLAPNFIGQPQVTYNLEVQANDIASQGVGVTTSLSRITEQPANGVASVFNNGTVGDTTDDVVAFRPDGGFQGTDQFSYEIIDSNGLVSEATVTVQVGSVLDDDIIEWTTTFTDAMGNPITEVSENTPFFINVYVRDIRENEVFPDLPAAQVDRRGVFAAYVDVLFDSDKIVVTGEPVRTGIGNVPASPFQSRQDGTTFVPGLVDELGGIASTDVNNEPPPTGTDPLLVARIPVRALTGSAGSNVPIMVDPADLRGVDETDEVDEVSGIHDPLIFEPATDVEVSEERFTTSTINIIAGPGGEGEAHNQFTPVDVNNDRAVNMRDVRDMFASLSSEGVGPVGIGSTSTTVGAEGEAGSARYTLKIDVNNDGFRSVTDLRLVYDAVLDSIFGFVAQANGEAEAEGEGEANTEPAETPMTPLAPSQAADVDLLLATDDNRASIDTTSSSRRQADRILAELDADFFNDIGDVWE